MATVDPRKLKDQAAKAVEKKNYAKAAELYLQVAELEPGEPDWRQRAGEALRRAGDPAQAVVQLAAAAHGYAASGLLLKAIAVCKLVLQIEPAHTTTQGMLARLYSQRDASAPPAPRTVLARSSSGQFEMVPAAPAPAPAPLAAVAPRHAPAPDPLDELVMLDEVPRPGPAIPPGAPIEVVPLASFLGGRKSGQFPVVTLESLEAAEVAADAAAYEISLDGPMLTIDDLDGGLGLAGPAMSAPAPTPTPPPKTAPAAPPVARLDDDLDFSELTDEPAPEPPAPALPRIPLFSSLAAAQLQHLIERVEVRELAAGEAVVRQGERGGALFVVVEGRVRVLVDDQREVAALGAGEFFGELALLTDFPRSATVVADAPTQVLELSRALISDLVAQQPEVLRTLLRFFRDRLVDRLLGSSELFSAFSADDARQLAARFVFLELEPRMRVIRQGERAPGLFLILCGEAQVVRDQNRLARLGPGDVFGEMSLLSRGGAMAHIDTVTKCWALELPRAEFQEIITTYPQVLDYISTLAERRAERNQDSADARVDFL